MYTHTQRVFCFQVKTRGSPNRSHSCLAFDLAASIHRWLIFFRNARAWIPMLKNRWCCESILCVLYASCRAAEYCTCVFWTKDKSYKQNKRAQINVNGKVAISDDCTLWRGQLVQSETNIRLIQFQLNPINIHGFNYRTLASANENDAKVKSSSYEEYIRETIIWVLNRAPNDMFSKEYFSNTLFDWWLVNKAQMNRV